MNIGVCQMTFWDDVKYTLRTDKMGWDKIKNEMIAKRQVEFDAAVTAKKVELDIRFVNIVYTTMPMEEYMKIPASQEIAEVQSKIAEEDKKDGEEKSDN